MACGCMQFHVLQSIEHAVCGLSGQNGELIQQAPAFVTASLALASVLAEVNAKEAGACMQCLLVVITRDLQPFMLVDISLLFLLGRPLDLLTRFKTISLSCILECKRALCQSPIVSTTF